jgi:predicted Holliday junction resolvase-like endonuclease
MDPFMTFWIFLIGIIVGVIIGIILLYRTAVSPLHKKIEKLNNEIKALMTTYGKTTEQHALFMKQYPYSIERFRYLGTPIDGIQFEDDQILFVEFKTTKSKLGAAQNRIKKLVKQGKVKWFEFRTK